MCLSTVYKNDRAPEHIMLKNIRHLRFEPGKLICTDLLERETELEGVPLEADLVNGWIVMEIKETR